MAALAVISVPYLTIFLVENQKLNQEEIIILMAFNLTFFENQDLINALNHNREIRKKLYADFLRTGDFRYYNSYVDASYTLEAFSTLGKKRPLTEVEFRILITNLKANNAYYYIHTSPQVDVQMGTFSSKSPYDDYKKFTDTKFTSKLPFVYYKGQGWQLYPVTSTFWASVYFERGDYQSGIEILDELSQYMSVEEYKGMKYGLFKVYFKHSNSSIPWTSSYSQGMAAGLYAQAYNKTKDKKYLDQSNLLFSSFKIPLNEGGFITPTKFGNWFLEYNFKPDHLILNGHIITMKGIYNYYQVTGDPFALELFKNGTTSVKNILPPMDSGDWSYYALTGKDAKPAWKASEYYHGLDVELLKWLYATTGDVFFNEYATKWDNYLKNKK
ncbi:MAG: hypothetical protein BME94_06095 [Methanobacteriales archaeon Met13]